MDITVTDERGLEYIGKLEQPTTLHPEMMDSFRPAENVRRSEIELDNRSLIYQKRSVHRAASARYLAMKSRSRLFSRASTFASRSAIFEKVPSAGTLNLQKSTHLLRAEEYQMELLNKERERQYLHVLKHAERYKIPKESSFTPEENGIKPTSLQDVKKYKQEEYEKMQLRDDRDESVHQSYTKFELPYYLQCLQRIKDVKRKYEMQFRHELAASLKMQPSAYAETKFAQ